MAPGGHLFLSGFYTADVDMLEAAAKELGLKKADVTERCDWACLHLIKS